MRRRAADAPFAPPPRGSTHRRCPCRRCRTPCRGRGWCARRAGPSVTLTPSSTPRYLTGIRPWSCVIATTTSNSPGWPSAWRARMNTVSGANGPRASMPSAARRRDGRRDDPDLLVAEQAALAGVRVQAGDGDPRHARDEAACRRVRDAQRLEHGLVGDGVDRRGARTCGSSPARCGARRWPASCAPAARHAAFGSQRLQHLGVPGERDAGRGKGLLVDGRGDERGRLARRVSATARSMQRAAAAPARASTRPSGASSRSSASPCTWSTGRQSAGTSLAAAALSSSATGSIPPVSATARRMTPTSPTSTQPPRPASGRSGRRSPGRCRRGRPW